MGSDSSLPVLIESVIVESTSLESHVIIYKSSEVSCIPHSTKFLVLIMADTNVETPHPATNARGEDIPTCGTKFLGNLCSPETGYSLFESKSVLNPCDDFLRY